MLQTTSGIILHTIRYGEYDLIANILTRNSGFQSYYVQGVRKSKSKFKVTLFRPLSLIELVVYHKDTAQLQRIRDISVKNPTLQIGSDIRKTTIALFIAELLLHVFRQQELNSDTFDYIYNSVVLLENADSNLGVFHIVFMLQLTRYLGFAPARNFSDDFPFFSLREGRFQQNKHSHLDCLDQAESRYFFRLSDPALSNLAGLTIPSNSRSKMLRKCIDYYSLHIDGFGRLNSLPVLESIFSG